MIAAVVVLIGFITLDLTVWLAVRRIVQALDDNAAMQTEQLQTDLRGVTQDIAGAISALNHTITITRGR